jgi:hypothetical protein
LHVDTQFSQHHLLRRLCFHYCVFGFLEISLLQTCGLISELSILFHWPMCLFLCQYHTSWFTVHLWYIMKPDSVVSLAFFILLKIILAIESLLLFHINLTIFFLYCEKDHCYFDSEYIEMINCFGYYEHFNNIYSSNS